MNDYIEAGALVALALAGSLALARFLDRTADAVVTEDEDDVGYFLDRPVALRGLPADSLPRCPDYIPDWMMEEHSAS